ncbi:MAG: aldehyde ferredoxin oxidoreductase family protein [Planctomycetes bacterium]|nr:aldehyde ferredoxin oxidoreductase family protein [Planctomycetota bacterium]
MAVPGTMGRILFVDLDTQEITEETPADEVYLSYLGGYGLGAYYLYTLQKPGVDPLGPDNHLGFFTGLLTGTPAITGNRYVVVAKSPKTGTWGDANSGGSFGPSMKTAGFDGVVFRGVSEKPVYLLLRDGKAELVPADDWWGLDTNDLEDRVKEQYGKKAGLASIGPSGERCQLLSCVINNKGRAAGRSGLGAVMGSKKLKAIVAVGDVQIPMADADGMKEAVSKHRTFMKAQGFFDVLSQYGTAGLTAGACASGDTPIKNWGGVPDDFPTVGKISDDAVMATQKRKYACWRCPIGCGGETVVEQGDFASHTHKPEYETLGAFGTMCLNDNLESINLCNEICNRQGLDTISTACTVAFAIECYENGIITNEDTGGIQLNWGNAEAIVAITRAMADCTGFGKVLADGAKVAAERIGKGAEQYAIHVGGEEVPMHDPRLNPGLATSYKMDATPGRHTQMGSWTVEGQFAPPGLFDRELERYSTEGKGEAYCVVGNNHHAVSAAGMCMFAWCNLTPAALTDSLSYTTGHQFTLDEVQEVGARIANLRIAFNLREGVRNVDIPMHGRLVGTPPLEAGPLAGVTVDLDTQVKDFLAAMGWDTETGVPTKDTLEGLGLDFVAADLHG